MFQFKNIDRWVAFGLITLVSSVIIAKGMHEIKKAKSN
jgi:hypothetical protein